MLIALSLLNSVALALTLVFDSYREGHTIRSHFFFLLFSHVLTRYWSKICLFMLYRSPVSLVLKRIR